MVARASIFLGCVVALLVVGIGTACPDGQDCPTVTPTDNALQNIAQQRQTYRMEIFVFTYNRLESMKRLWRSLVNATYLPDIPVDATIFMDYDEDQESPVHNWLSGVTWPHGYLRIHKREQNVGLRKSIEEAWYPTSPDSFGAFFEDDIEVSPDWFVWVDNAIQEYYYRAGQPPKLVGLSLFRGLWNILTREYTNWETNGAPFIFQQPQSWGQIFFPRPWRYFRTWIHYVKDPTCHGVQLTSNMWRSSGTWKKYLIKMMYEDGLYMIYPNFPNQMSLSMHHMEAGVHFKRGMRDDPVWALRTLVPLLSKLAVQEWTASGFNPLACPPLEKLQVYDIVGRHVTNTSELYNSHIKLPLGYLFPHERKTADPNVYDLSVIFRKDDVNLTAEGEAATIVPPR